MKKKSGFSALATLMAALTVSENFTLNSAALIAEQPQWADPYNSNFKKIIEKFLAEYFGITSRNQLKEATRLVTSLQAEAKEDLGIIKTQIIRNFRKAPDRKASLLDLLGYSAHWKKASNSNQGELIALLFAFANNLKPELRTELEGKNVNASRLTKIVGFKQSLSDANITQETLKGSSKLETATGIAALNEIYDQAMDICLTGQRLFRKDRERRDMFIFTKIARKQGVFPETKKEEPPEGTTPATAKSAAKK